ncbi:hypothetical protein [Coleofasciculus sp.]|uniref:hypothetical protein n=1 Tax=Coleofasciculus sp. TaxID=3100458 RepID=UPI0039F88F00
MPKHENHSHFTPESLTPQVIQTLQDFYQKRKIPQAQTILENCGLPGELGLEMIGAIAPVSEEDL